MPGFVTHHFFGYDVFRAVENKMLRYACSKFRSSFLLGLQGPDIFFNHVPALLHQDARNIGSFLHENRVNLFFDNCFKELSKASREDKKIILSYVCGFLCHYALDSSCHPFIYARTNYIPNRSSYEYISAHSDIENVIDGIILKERKGIKLSDFKQHTTYLIRGKEKKIICRLLSNVIMATCGDIYKPLYFNVTPNYIKKVLFEGAITSKILNDPKGYKKRLVSYLEDKLMPYHLLADKFVTNLTIPINDPLNLSHDTWYNPWNNEIKSSNSFIDEYNRAKLFACKIMNAIDTDMFFSSNSFSECKYKNLLHVIDSYSYHSGLST